MAVCSSVAVVALIALLIARIPESDSEASAEMRLAAIGTNPLGSGNTIARADRAARYYIGIGVSQSRSVLIEPSLLRGARSFLASQVGRLDGVILAPESETSLEAQSVLREQSLSGFYLDATISSVERQANGGLRASVSILVATYPGRDMRAIMRGAATAVNGADPGARRKAIEAALTSALRQLGKALALDR